MTILGTKNGLSFLTLALLGFLYVPVVVSGEDGRESEVAAKVHSQIDPDKDQGEKSKPQESAPEDNPSAEHSQASPTTPEASSDNSSENKDAKPQDPEVTIDATPQPLKLDPQKAVEEFSKTVAELLKSRQAPPPLPNFESNAELMSNVAKFIDAGRNGDHSTLPNHQTMKELHERDAVFWSKIVAEFTQHFGPPRFPDGEFARPVNELVNGHTMGYGHDVVTARITHEGDTIPFLYYKSLTGSRVGFFPPIRVSRDEQDRLRIFVTDPDTGFDVVHPTSGERLDAEQFVQAVLSDVIPRDKEFDVTLELRIKNDETTRAALRQQIPNILARFIETRDAAPPTTVAVTPDDIHANDVAVANFQEVRFYCESPGCEQIVFTRKAENPTFGKIEEVSTRAPAWFVCRMLSSAGLSFRVEYRFPTFRAELTDVILTESIINHLEILAEEIGEGGLSTHDDRIKKCRRTGVFRGIRCSRRLSFVCRPDFLSKCLA